MVDSIRLIDEALHGCPASDQSTYPVSDGLQGCLAAIAAGEPKRAVQLLTAAHHPRERKAITAWALQLDRNRYPGGVGAEMDTRDCAEDMFVVPDEGDPEFALLEHVVNGGPPGLATMRTVLWDSVRTNAVADVGDGVGIARQKVAALREFSTRAGHSNIVLWTLLADADLARLAMLPNADALMGEARQRIADADEPGLCALSHLIEGDWYATPGSSPESLGHHLGPQTGPSPCPEPDADLARGCYRRAGETLGDAEVPRLRSALFLREAMLDTVGGDPAAGRTLLESALQGYRRCGDQMGYHLAAIHTMVADIEQGQLFLHAADLGDGWHRPTRGTVADLLDWATTVGSTSWAVGLGRMLEQCAAQWRARGNAIGARVGFLAAAALQALDPNRAPLVYEIVHCEASLNLTTNALVRMERASATMLDQAGADDSEHFAVFLQIAMTLLDRLRAWSRGPAAPYAADRLDRLGAQLHHLISVREHSQDAAQANDETAQMLTGVLRQLAAQADVHAAMTRGEHAGRIGALPEADRWFDVALEAARRDDAAGYLAALVLASARRNDAVRAELDALAAKDALPDELTVRLASQISDRTLAAATLDRMDATGYADTDWHDRLLRAEVELLRGDTAGARGTLETAIVEFEDTLGQLPRDSDRLSACNGIDAALLYATYARAQRELPGGPRASLTTCEHLRALSYPELGAGVEVELRQRWQHSVAQFAAVAERLVADLSQLPPDQADTTWAAFEDADARLAEVEHELDVAHPGMLLRAAVPDTRHVVAELQERLAADTVLLEYLAVADHVLAWAVTRDEVRSVARPVNPRELAATVRSYHLGCSTDRAPATGLAQLLLEPFADLVRTHPRVVVVPSGDLTLVPFQALSFDGAALGLTHVVSYLPRAETYRPDEAIRITSALVVGDPDFDRSLRPNLKPLPGARVEARTVGRRLADRATSVLIGAEATASEISRRAGGCGLLHLSTHGHLDELSGFASSLVLAGSDELTVADLAGVRFGTELAVLSGCDTGRGSATLGGDLIGLTRALLRGGAGRAVVSMWPVDDDVAPVVMDHFYAGLTDGQPPAQALAAAQRAVFALDADALSDAYAALGGHPEAGRRRRGTDLHPAFEDDEEIPAPMGGDAERYWAPFVLVG